MISNKSKYCVAVWAFLISISCLAAELKLPTIFSDGMVLQQGIKVPVWGHAAPDSKVTVSFKGQEKETKADAEGKWQLKLDILKASSTPVSLVVSSGAKSYTIKNVLIGEVWFCSGQSNMDFTMATLTRTARNEKYKSINDYIRKETETAADPLFRQFTVEKATSPFKQLETMKGSWISSSPENNPAFSATAYFFGRELRQKLGVPVALIKSAWGGTRVEPWIPESAYLNNKEMAEYYSTNTASLKKMAAEWDQAAVDAKYATALKKWQETKKGRKPRKKENSANKQTVPSTLFNAMVKPLMPFAIKGTIWYQGESNANYNNDKYEKHFKAMIASWRQLWGQGDFPFYFVQLANFKKPVKEPVDYDGWALICEQQRRSLSLKNTGMAVANDIGDARDIHPKNKVDVGKRLALWALKKDYNQEISICSGPIYKSHEILGTKVLITFDYSASGLMSGKKNLMDKTQKVDEALSHFQICGEDRQWKWAQANITSNNTIEVFHAEVTKPTIVRYAWARNPEAANLYNKEGLPASVFTTEKDLPVAEVKSKSKSKAKTKRKKAKK